jgi:hypothetical protein
LIDFCIVSAILVSSMMSFFISEINMSMLVEYIHLSNFDLSHVAFFMMSVVNFDYTSL